MPTPETLIDGLCFVEGPRWHDDRLYFSDMHQQEVRWVDLTGRSEVVVRVPGDPSGLGWLPDGRLLVVSMRDRRLLRLDGDELSEVADLSGLASHHCNDMVVDGRGNAYVGNFGFDLHTQATPTPAELVLVTPEGKARVVAKDMRFPNGTVITPDGNTLIVGESFGGVLTAFDIEADGGLANRREWARVEGAIPDGICLDAEGAIWMSSPISKEFVRVHEGGRVSERIAIEQQAIACMLGGPDGRTLFLCSSDDVDPEACKRTMSARISTVPVEVPAAGWP